MKPNLFSYLTRLALLVFALPTFLLAYCVIFPPFGKDVIGVAQRTIIKFDKENKRVDLIPQISFTGNSKDFAVVVPTPTQPELSPVDATIFLQASILTQPVRRNANADCGCDEDFGFTVPAGASDTAADEDTRGDVNVVSEQIVGIFQTVILTAEDANALTNWLNDNGYHFSDDDSDILDYYIQKDWFFTAMKVDTTQFVGDFFGTFSGGLDPARLTFIADELIYPLQISSISTKDNNDILIYVISDHKMTFDGAMTEYANKVTQAELEAMEESYPVLSNYINKENFITKLRRNFKLEEMDTDFEIIQASDDKEFREINYAGVSAGIIILVVFELLMLIRRRFYKKSESISFKETSLVQKVH